MGKKKVNVLSYLYIIGMAIVAIGFCCPMFKGILELQQMVLNSSILTIQFLFLLVR